MLIVSRRCGERIMIGADVKVTVISVCGSTVRIGIDAPRSVGVDREEVYRRKALPVMSTDPAEPPSARLPKESGAAPRVTYRKGLKR